MAAMTQVWFTHLFRDRSTKLVHCIVSMSPNLKTRDTQIMLCGISLSQDQAWRRPPMDTPELLPMTCPKCIDGHTNLFELTAV